MLHDSCIYSVGFLTVYIVKSYLLNQIFRCLLNNKRQIAATNNLIKYG